MKESEAAAVSRKLREILEEYARVCVCVIRWNVEGEWKGWVRWNVEAGRKDSGGWVGGGEKAT